MRNERKKSAVTRIKTAWTSNGAIKIFGETNSNKKNFKNEKEKCKMTKEIFMNEMMSDEQLDEVAGGNAIDRSFVINTLKEKGLSSYLASGSSNAEILEKTGKKYGIEYRANTFDFDEIKINGTWRSTYWVRDHQDESIAFIKRKIGIQ